MEDSKKNYTSEGRVLRPRRKVSSSNEQHRSSGRDGESRSFNRDGASRSYGNSERRSYSRDGQQRSYSRDGESRSYSKDGQGRSYNRDGEHRSFNRDGQSRSYNHDGERRSGYSRQGGYSRDGQSRFQGGSSEGRSFNRDGEHRSFNRDGENRSYNRDGEHRSFSRDGQSRQYGEKRQGGYSRNSGFKSNYSGGRGGRKPFRKDDYQFDDREDSGINRMISRSPQVDSIKYSDNDNVRTSAPEEMRLNRYIANSGVCSRREADTYIQAGVVTVNGEVVTELGAKVNTLTDDVRFNGERLKGEDKVYIVMNKPKGYVTTASDPHAEKTVMDLLKGCNYRIFPVGRLDKATTGVLMLTNDGEMSERLTHPSYDKKKIYQVILDNNLKQEDYEKILEGITLSDGDIKADELEYIDEHDHRKLGIEIHSGKNRIVRRIFESLGYEVRALDRVYFAGLTKKGLKKGEWRYLTEGEVNILKMGAYI